MRTIVYTKQSNNVSLVIMFYNQSENSDLHAFSKHHCCFQERYTVILAIKLITGMPRVQKVSKKNCHPSFLCSSTYK